MLASDATASIDPTMRTTLDLDDDVLASAKEIARRENKTAGQVLSFAFIFWHFFHRF